MVVTNYMLTGMALQVEVKMHGVALFGIEFTHKCCPFFGGVKKNKQKESKLWQENHAEKLEKFLQMIHAVRHSNVYKNGMFRKWDV